MPRKPGERNPYAGRPYRRETAAMKADPRNHECCICGGWIDIRLPHNDPGEWTREHVQSLVDGGELLGKRNSAAAHRSCNSSAGGRIGRRRTPPPAPIRELRSREW